MKPDELMKIAHDAKPEIMEKVASNLKLIEVLAPEILPEAVEELKDIIEITNTKVAGLADMGKLLAGSAVAALGGAIATDLFDAAKRKLTKGTNWNRILEANPELVRDFDTKRLKQSFDLVHKYAPEFMSDPIMGGSILKAVAELPGNEAAIVKDLIKSRSEYVNTKKNQFDIGRVGTPIAQEYAKSPRGEATRSQLDAEPGWLKDYMFRSQKGSRR